MKNVTTDVKNVKVLTTIVLYVLMTEYSLSTKKMIFQTNVFALPINSKEQMEVAKNVTTDVLNAQLHGIIVTPVPTKEYKILNQTAHAQVINTRQLMDIVPNVHSGAVNVKEPLTLVMVKNVLTRQEP